MAEARVRADCAERVMCAEMLALRCVSTVEATVAHARREATEQTEEALQQAHALRMPCKAHAHAMHTLAPLRRLQGRPLQRRGRC